MISTRTLFLAARVAAVVAAVVAPLALSAQRDTTQRDTTHLALVVITATRLPTRTTDQPTTVTVLDGAALRREGITHLGDALRRVPGLALARNSSFGSSQQLFLRGGQSNYVRVLVDGVPLNQPGGVLDVGRVTLDDVERVEVVRGPASVLYGSEAVTGVIQIVTRDGQAQRRVRAELGGGSYGGERASLGASGRTGLLRWSVQGDHHASDGILPFNNGYVNDGLTTSLASAGANWDARLTGRYNTSAYHYPTESDGSIADRNAERTEHRLVTGLDAGWRVDNRVSFRTQFSAMDFLPRDHDGPDNAGDTLGFYGYAARATVRRRLADARTIVRLGTRQLVTAGFEYTRDTERSRSTSYSEFGVSPDSFRAVRENRALYVQGQGGGTRWNYVVGGRMDDNSAFGIYRTARAGVSASITNRVRVRANAGTAFKAPSFFENFATGWVLGNPTLRPEQSRSADVGVELALPRSSALRVTAFAEKFRNLIQYTGAPAMGEPNYYNVAAANAGGIEVEATLPTVFGIASSVGHTWTDTRVADAGFDTAPEANFVQDGRLLRRPDHVTTLHLRRSWVAGPAVSATVIRTGEREDRDFATFPAGIVELKPYTTVDLSAEAPVPFRVLDGARVILRLDNALDVRTQQVAGFDSPGRSLYVGLKLER